ACPKRYPIHPNMLPAVRNAMALHTQIGKPFFTGITIEDDTLTYTAYTCDPANGDTEEYDHLSITKTTFPAPNPNYKPLPTDFLSTLPQQIWSFFTMVFRAVFVDYLFGLLPVAIRG
ncbi:MAG: hypothetical protein FWF60_03795, partial [Oscillospiraceae bacterium]|nr:hypothetical protein [Oscillospiraceae bacterium]